VQAMGSAKMKGVDIDEKNQDRMYAGAFYR